MRFGSPHPSGSFVYAVIGGGLVKIGRATDVAARVEQIRAMSPVEVWCYASAPGDYAEESSLHRRFDAWRHHGEWFDLPPDQFAALVNYLNLLTSYYSDWYQDLINELADSWPADVAAALSAEELEVLMDFMGEVMLIQSAE